mgnify:FL=1
MIRSVLLGLLWGGATAAPTMSLIEDAECGQQRFGVDEDGSFTLAVFVMAGADIRYNCSAHMVNVNATPDADCAGLCENSSQSGASLTPIEERRREFANQWLISTQAPDGTPRRTKRCRSTSKRWTRPEQPRPA